MENFVFSNPTKVIFGKGQISRLGKEIKPYGNRILLVYGGGSIKKNGVYDQVIEQLTEIDATVFELSGVEPNPRLTTVHKGIEICKNESIDFILAVGAGSVLDASKAIAIGAKYDGDVWDIITKKARSSATLPLGTILTHAATGSEINGSSVVTHWELKQKIGWGSVSTYPKFSILDPTFTMSVSKEQTVFGIVDMMCHVLETYFGDTKNIPLQDRLCEGILLTIMETAPKLVEDLTNYDYRETMMFSASMALYGPTRMGNPGDWATHDIEHVISAVYDIPHGAGLAIIYPHWLTYSANINPKKHVQLATRVFGVDPTGKTDKEIALEGIEKLKQFWQELGAPTTLAHYDINDSQFAEMAEMCCANGEIGRYVKLDQDAVLEILNMAK